MVREYSLTFTVEAEPNGRPVYRIWVDDELMCEREFWLDPNEFYINEQTVLDLEEGRHVAKLELVNHCIGSCSAKKLRITNLTTNSTSEHALPPMQGREQIIPFSAK